MATNQSSAVSHLDPRGGRIAYDIDGTGPLVVLADITTPAVVHFAETVNHCA